MSFKRVTLLREVLQMAIGFVLSWSSKGASTM